MRAHSGQPPARIRTAPPHAHASPRSSGRYRLPLADIDEGGVWDGIPAASLLAVFRCLDSKDVAAACCVCSHWREVGSARSLWKELLVKEFKCVLLLLRRISSSTGGQQGAEIWPHKRVPASSHSGV